GLQSLGGVALKGGDRDLPLGEPGRAVPLPLHLAGEQPPLPLTDAVPPRAAGPDAARAGRRSDRPPLAGGQRGTAQGRPARLNAATRCQRTRQRLRKSSTAAAKASGSS